MVVSQLAFGPNCPRCRIAPEIFSEEKIVNVDEVNQRRCSEESGQRLENVYCMHLILASGKLVLKNQLFICFFSSYCFD